jgi:hypothetical protein
VPTAPARLTGDPEAGERFLKKALRAGILLEVNGDLIDLARVRPVELFGLCLHNMLAWRDNEQRKHLFQQARWACAYGSSVAPSCGAGG